MEGFRSWVIARLIPHGECMVWPDPPHAGTRYPRAKWGGRNFICGRVVLRITESPLLALHTCDNPMCLKLEHLYAGSSQDNVDDRVGRLRSVYSRGEAHGMVRLNDTAVRCIRFLHERRGVTQRRIAMVYSMSKASICLIVNRKKWTHV